MFRIDLDHNATTPMEPEARQAMITALEELQGNASAIHSSGRRAHAAIQSARESVARLIGANAEEVAFTSGGTEANNLALRGSVPYHGGKLIISSIEHPSILECAAELERDGATVVRIDPDATGVVRPADFLNALSEGADILSVILANNETGCIQPIDDVAKSAHERNVRVHSDAVQAVGRMPIDVRKLGVDLLTFSAHKIGGPKGVAALWARNGDFPRSIIHGGDQESGVRAGTENVAAIVGFGRAAEIVASRVSDYAHKVARLRDLLEKEILEKVKTAQVIGDSCERVANTSYLAFPGLEATSVVQLLDLKGIASSTGAACEVASEDYSHVLRAMKVPKPIARGAVRFSLSYHTTEDEIRQAVMRITDAALEMGDI